MTDSKSASCPECERDGRSTTTVASAGDHTGPTGFRLESLRRFYSHPAAISLLYVGGGLLWLLAGDPLLAAWLADGAPALPSHLPRGLLVLAASGGLFYGLLSMQANAMRRAFQARDIARDRAARQRTEDRLRQVRSELEARVQERTAELLAINRTLEQQNAARMQVEFALRDSEERFRQLTEHLREVFWVYGLAEERILYISPTYEEIWGRPIHALHERALDWLEAVHPDDRSRLQTAHANKLESGFFNEEYRIVRPDGAVRWIWDRGFPIRDDGNHIYRIAGLAEDITTRKLAEDQLRRQQVELAKMARLSLAVELASNMAHELNQPLAAIVAYTQACVALLHQDQTDPRVLTGTLEEVVQQAMRAGGIIRHLRDLVRKHPTTQTALDLNTLIRSVVHYAQSELRQIDTALNLELTEPLPAVLADDIQIQLVVLYLLRNALEAMQQTEIGARELTVRTAPADASTVRVTISDTGHGLVAEAAERLFQPFFSTKPGGMGLSLSVSRSIVESQGGRLWATSNPDRGTSFHFTLPRHTNPGFIFPPA
jgi:two-component system, LuxR family, sensor kinase FixL